jgi:competence protein ComEC
MTLLIRFSEWAAAQPGTWFNVRSPGLVITVAYYALLLGVMTPELRRGRRWLASLALPAMVLLVSAAGGWWAGRHRVVLTVLALRSGAAMFVDGSGGANDLLIDCGDEASAKGAVVPFLQAQGVNRLAHLVVTHGDVRHVGGAETVVAAFRPRQVTVSGLPSRSPSYRRLLRSLDAAPERRVRVSAGDAVAGWTVLHPVHREGSPQADDNVVVVAGTFLNVRVLLLGDLGPAGQAALLQRGVDLRADLVVAGVPTHGEPVSEALLTAIQPRLIVVQDAEYPANERVRPHVRARLEGHGVPVLYASTDGTITLRLRSGRWEAQAMTGRHVGPAGPMP